MHHLLPSGGAQRRVQRRLQRHHFPQRQRHHDQLRHLNRLRIMAQADVPRVFAAGTLVARPVGTADQHCRVPVLDLYLLLVLLAAQHADDGRGFQLVVRHLWGCDCHLGGVVSVPGAGHVYGARRACCRQAVCRCARNVVVLRTDRKSTFYRFNGRSFAVPHTSYSAYSNKWDLCARMTWLVRHHHGVMRYTNLQKAQRAKPNWAYPRQLQVSRIGSVPCLGVAIASLICLALLGTTGWRFFP